NDYGQFSLMPITGQPVFDQDARASWFSHKAEIAKPYYYSVFLADHDVKTEFSPSQRAVVFKFTFPKTDSAYIVIDAFDKGSFIKVIPEENKIIGYNTRNSGGTPETFKNSVIIEFDQPRDSDGVVHNGNIKSDGLEVTADNEGAIIGVKGLQSGQQITAHEASSFISFEQASLNLNEVREKSLEEVANEGRQQWNEVLGRIRIKDQDIDRLRTFYSCLYRSTLFPRDLSEIDA